MEDLAEQAAGGSRPARAKPPKWWIAVTAVAGATGALGGVAAFGSGTYVINGIEMEFRATPTVRGMSGTTQFTCGQPLVCPVQGHAEAETHQAPLDLRVTVLGPAPGETVRDPAMMASPHQMAFNLRHQREAREAGIAFALKVAGVAAAGGLVAGGAISLGRWRRIPGALLAGILTIGLIGFITNETYDEEAFRDARFVPAGPGTGLPGSEDEGLLPGGP